MESPRGSESSFDPDNSIFSRPLQDLPIFKSLDLIPPSQSVLDTYIEWGSPSKAEHLDDFEPLDPNTDLNNLPAEWPLKDESRVRLFEPSDFQLQEILDQASELKEKEPDFLMASSHLKELLSAPYNEKKPISLKVNKLGDTLVINKMHPY